MARAAETATREAVVSAHRLSEMPQIWRDLVRPRANSSTAKLIDRLVASPFLNAHIAQQMPGSDAPRTYEAIEKLAGAGILREITGGARNRVWVVSDVATEIADLDERIGKRANPVGAVGGFETLRWKASVIEPQWISNGDRTDVQCS